VRLTMRWLTELARYLATVRKEAAGGPDAQAIGATLAANLPALFAVSDEVVLRFHEADVTLDGQPLLLEHKAKQELLHLGTQAGMASLRLKAELPAAELWTFLHAVALVLRGEPGGAVLAERLANAGLSHVDWTSPADDPADADGGEADAFRSDDWTTGVVSLLTDRPLAVSQERPDAAVALCAAYHEERTRSLVRAAVDAARPCLQLSEDTPERVDFSRFLFRALRFSLVEQAWDEGCEILDLLSADEASTREVDALGQEALASPAMNEFWDALDSQPLEKVRTFIEFARRLGTASCAWLLRAMAESNERRNRRRFAQALSEICRENPGELESGLTDSRWYVVRNVVFVLGLIGGDGIVPYLRRVIRHPERRVRRQCLVALGTMSPEAARPLLLGMLAQSEPEVAHGALEMLSARRDPVTAEKLLELLGEPAMEQKPVEERLAIYRAVGKTADASNLALFEAHILHGKGPVRATAPEWSALAQAVAQIGGASAVALLEAGRDSRQGMIRGACAAALSQVRSHERAA
jgi:HEAT repeat protein